MKKLLAALLLVVAFVAIALWLADRPIDEFPQLPDGMGHIAFNPDFGPRTPQEVQKYVQKRGVDTLQHRWGLRPGMSQEEIDTVREGQAKVWTFVLNTRTTRYKVRSWLGMNQ